MLRVRVLALAVWLLSYGAVSARQPAVRASVPLPAPAAEIARLLALPSDDRSQIVLHIIRLLFDAPDGIDADDVQLRAKLVSLFDASPAGETAPLPLDPSIWRETILARQVPDEDLLGAILSNRQTALLYYGLAALDDETLGALGTDRALLKKLTEHAGTFAAFGRSLRVKGGRVDVPGGSEYGRLWEEIVGAPVSNTSDFARRLFAKQDSRLAFFYDTIAHLERAQQLFALSGGQVGRVRALADSFERAAVELRVYERPFSRLYVDPSLTLAAIAVTPNGTPKGPASRGLWDLVFKDSERIDHEFQPARIERSSDTTPIDGAWIVSRIHRHSAIVAHRRRDAYLFAQRVFTKTQPGETADIATALRGMISFPALLLTLERTGVTSPAIMAAAAVRAHAINRIGDGSARRIALMIYQSSLGILERIVLSGGLSPSNASVAVLELAAIDFAKVDAPTHVANWISRHLSPSGTNGDGPSAESRLLSRMAGVPTGETRPVIVEWEGQQYRVNAADAELQRLILVRERQGGPSLDDALAGPAGPAKRENGEDASDPGLLLGQVLSSILYAAHLGEPDSSALAADNVALRHAFQGQNGSLENSWSAWRVALDNFGRSAGWRLTGSLLGLDVPLARHALRRLDMSVMPAPPTLTANERHVVALTAAFLRHNAMTDATRDEITAAVGRGRQRVAALTSSGGRVDEIARDAGMSGWRREALAWTLAHQPDRTSEHFSPLDLFWLGTAGQEDYSKFDPWGAAAYPLSGCLCLVMPRPGPWETLAGRPAMGVLAARGADVTIVVAEALSRMRLPAALAPGVAAYALQDALDATLPAYFDDWSPFGRAAAALPQESIVNYVAALTAGGPLLPVTKE